TRRCSPTSCAPTATTLLAAWTSSSPSSRTCATQSPRAAPSSRTRSSAPAPYTRTGWRVARKGRPAKVRIHSRLRGQCWRGVCSAASDEIERRRRSAKSRSHPAAAPFRKKNPEWEPRRLRELFGDETIYPYGRFALCNVDGGTCVAQFACGGVGGVSGYGFEDGLGRSLDQVLGFFQAQVGQLTDHLDDLDLLGTEV